MKGQWITQIMPLNFRSLFKSIFNVVYWMVTAVTAHTAGFYSGHNHLNIRYGSLLWPDFRNSVHHLFWECRRHFTFTIMIAIYDLPWELTGNLKPKGGLILKATRLSVDLHKSPWEESSDVRRIVWQQKVVQLLGWCKTWALVWNKTSGTWLEAKMISVFTLNQKIGKWTCNRKGWQDISRGLQSN